MGSSWQDEETLKMYWPPRKTGVSNNYYPTPTSVSTPKRY